VISDKSGQQHGRLARLRNQGVPMPSAECPCGFRVPHPPCIMLLSQTLKTAAVVRWMWPHCRARPGNTTSGGALRVA